MYHFLSLHVCITFFHSVSLSSKITVFHYTMKKSLFFITVFHYTITQCPPMHHFLSLHNEAHLYVRSARMSPTDIQCVNEAHLLLHKV